ncbi:MAG: hypothetical protein A2Y14_01070 [Verrucomicrobia bacterium GWF2_51_19]|nr:MAG: hypothetical protein A2Y14_01070 [Verrucomicrobia bacterium GWF2_51_19]HCJ12074.1 hypothetical protein [Opitutae bacterium]
MRWIINIIFFLLFFILGNTLNGVESESSFSSQKSPCFSISDKKKENLYKVINFIRFKKGQCDQKKLFSSTMPMPQDATAILDPEALQTTTLTQHQVIEPKKKVQLSSKKTDAK